MNNAVIMSLDPPATPEPSVLAKLAALQTALRPRLEDGLLVAFSGGVDSAFLLWAAEQQRRISGGKLLALTTYSASLSRSDRDDVESFISETQIPHVWIESRELSNANYLSNDRSRCYYCKSELFRICGEVAGSNELGWTAYGYNSSDRGDFRPGHQAAIENSVISPLADAQLGKDDIRELMRYSGMKMADKPASPCLSSRVVTGVSITPKKLRDIEELEAGLRTNGLKVFRVRLHESDGAKFLRLEVSPEEIERAFELRHEFAAAARKRGFKWITLDLEGYKIGGANLPSK
jgi:pyridinium-3,5-biscarboxylic acid mononucleotide sulfurtransferase